MIKIEFDASSQFKDFKHIDYSCLKNTNIVNAAHEVIGYITDADENGYCKGVIQEISGINFDYVEKKVSYDIVIG